MVRSVQRPQCLCASQWFDSESFQTRTERRKEWKFTKIQTTVDLQQEEGYRSGLVLTECSDFGNCSQIFLFFHAIITFQHQYGNLTSTSNCSYYYKYNNKAHLSSLENQHQNKSHAPLDHSLLCSVSQQTVGQQPSQWQNSVPSLI